MIRLSKEIYDRETLLKSAFAFTDEAYIHLDSSQNYYEVTIVSKYDETSDNIDSKFENELIAQQTRKLISQSTKQIRELIVARAFASTLVDVSKSEPKTETTYSASSILKDWFEGYE